MSPWTTSTPTWLDVDGLWATQAPGKRLRLLAGARCWQPLLLPADADLGDEEVAGYVRAVFAQYLGSQADAPVLAWRQGEQRGAALWQGPALAALRATASAQGATLQLLQPLWWWQWRRALAREPGLAEADVAQLLVVEGDSLTHLGLQRGALVQLRGQRLDAATPQALADWCASEGLAGGRWMIGHGLAGEPDATTAPAGWIRIGRLDGAAPELGGPLAPNPLRHGLAASRLGAWLASLAAGTGPDLFTPSGRALARWGWALAATSAAVFTAAGLDAWQAHERVAAAEEQLAALGAARPAPQTPAAGTSSTAHQRLRSLLDHPWGATLAGLEAATGAGVRWQGLEQGAGRRELRATGVADDEAGALRVASLLAAQPGWQDVLPLRLRPLDRGAGVSFELQAYYAERDTAPDATPPAGGTLR